MASSKKTEKIPSSWFAGRSVSLVIAGDISVHVSFDLLDTLSTFSGITLHCLVADSTLRLFTSHSFERFGAVSEFSLSPVQQEHFTQHAPEADATVWIDFSEEQTLTNLFNQESSEGTHPHILVTNKNAAEAGIQFIGTWDHTIEALAQHLPADNSWNGKRVLVTAGPTEEDIDPVRFITNRSSGKMGFALARQAALRGAIVTLVTGPTALETPYNVNRIDIRTADEMLDACREYFDDSDAFFAAAAVEDLVPADAVEHKIKKQGSMTVECREAVDVLGTLAKQKTGQYLAGFSVETENDIENSREKLNRKSLDAIVVNNPREPGAAFQHDTNRATIIPKDGNIVEFPMQSKEALARELLDFVRRDITTP
ncbi:MAG: phosphopantothenoylcysteine decarboxylase [Candidatus Marinimicrobia bacterium]|nr:phosphopantothenoylcysteine decarboxylase [Candidatus Neomarinimicrobiota bacterium]MCF7829690.1 phosphopantothenoylcysteine decarboxylase [Candidatus Neomarinimicrobiota bacterium]MCF7881640.1 phosphopantothenoylcysteine decarboxylase [Candidatus Neomarinimicrobiota bacterium]